VLRARVIRRQRAIEFVWLEQDDVHALTVQAAVK
jgi:hypothetical protein